LSRARPWIASARLGRLICTGGLAARFRAHSLRFKLLALALCRCFGGAYPGRHPGGLGRSVLRPAADHVKVQSDLAVAHGYFDRVKEAVGRRVEALANSAQLERTLREQPGAVVSPGAQGLLRDAAQHLGLDFLNLLRRQRRVRWPAAARVAAGHAGLGSGHARALSGQAVYRHRHLFGRAAGRSSIRTGRTRAHPLIATANAQPTERGEESRGMVMHAAAPLARDAAGTVRRGVVVGGSAAEQEPRHHRPPQRNRLPGRLAALGSQSAPPRLFLG
jgi:hypothetical protein